MKSALCAATSCDRDAKTKGYCHKHYQRYLKHGDPDITFRPRAEDRIPAAAPQTWTFQGIWPITGPDANTRPTPEEARGLIELALGDVPQMARSAGAALHGKAQFAVAEGRHYPGSQGAAWVLVCRVPATPAPAREYHRKSA